MQQLTGDRVWSKNFILIKLLVLAYLIGLIVSHGMLGSEFVWPVAVFFSVAMNFTYPWAAWRQSSYISLEIMISVGLIWLSLLGIVVSPLCVIAAILLHGVWDIVKHKRRMGAPFFGWYLRGCWVWDFIYAGLLLWFFLG